MAARRSLPAAAQGPSMPDALTPRDHAERVALFRAELIGALARREFDHGELAAALRALAAEPYRPPGSATTRHFGASMLERWSMPTARGASPRCARRRARIAVGPAT